ncbi:MAG: hypothetical protein QY326_02370 [Bdellovibrionota bacterium]|nr:MAG: hypothetical protein QY326_02370 [Bdellovibrionota bacterium]
MRLESAKLRSESPPHAQVYSHPVLEIRPAFRAQPWLWLLIIACSGIALLVTPRDADYTQYLHIGSLSVPLPLLPLFPTLLFAVLVHRARDSKYVLGADHVTEVNGLLSFRLRSERIFYLHVRGIEVDQPLVGRFLNFGDVELTSDVTMATQTIVLRGIANPRRVKDEIQRRVANVLQSYSPGSPSFV